MSGLLSTGEMARMNRELDRLYATPIQDQRGLPIVNARLLAVAGGAFTEDYDTPAGAGVTSWTGDAQAYLTQETIIASPSGTGGVDELVRTRLAFDRDLATVAHGDTLTFVYDGDTLTRTARDVAVDELAGVVTVTFEDA